MTGQRRDEDESKKVGLKRALPRKGIRRDRATSTKNNPRQSQEITQLRQRVPELETQNEKLSAAQTRIKSLLARYRYLYDILPIGFFILSKSGEITEGNKTGAALLGIERERLGGIPFTQFIHEHAHDVFAQYVGRLKETRQKRSVELRLRRKDGKEFYGLISAVPITVVGRPFEIVVTLTDVTRARETMDKLEAIYGILMAEGARTLGPRPTVIRGGRAHVNGLESGKRIKFSVPYEEITAEALPASDEREDTARKIEEKIVFNINDLIIPYIEGLKRSNLDAEQKKLLAGMEESLKGIASPFIQNAFSRYVHLTAREIQVAGFIRYGCTTKEIAQILGISSNAVELHRNSLRRKFNLKHQKVNIRSFLLSLPL